MVFQLNSRQLVIDSCGVWFVNKIVEDRLQSALFVAHDLLNSDTLRWCLEDGHDKMPFMVACNI
jgi:hypothetical protein